MPINVEQYNNWNRSAEAQWEKRVASGIVMGHPSTYLIQKKAYIRGYIAARVEAQAEAARSMVA